METTKTQPLRHVVIGAGAGIFKLHRSCLELDTAELVGVADVNAAIKESLEAELGCPFYTDHKQMLDELKPDVAVVITPHPFHAPLAIDSLNAGCHVLVEKPIAVQVAEADAMIEAASKANRLLAINFQQRHNPQVQAIHQLIQSGQLGDIQHVNMAATWTRTASYFEFAGWRGTWKGEGGGVLMNQAPHNLDMLCYLVGQPSRVAAWTRTTVHKIETEDTVQAMLEWPNGALGSLHISTAEAGKPFWFEIIGTQGILQMAHDGLTYRTFTPDVHTHIAESKQMYSGPAIEQAEIELPEGVGNHEAVYRNLHDAILNGVPVAADGIEARKSLELANAMIYSSYTGEQVEMPLDREKYGALLEELKTNA
ncbi:Gfo/Idh/MocA family oxidoreductase [Chloroflexi bacterium TSY]|nr:Gfo/Idh/MocA family oxidoreductase [Chloroflexi bacterium TSY]